MSNWDLIFFSLVQGIGEFLPISSSGHLLLLKKVLHLEEVPLFFDILLHVATLLAILYFFRERVLSLLKSLWASLRNGFKALGGKEEREDQILILFILIATIFTGIIGIMVKESMKIWESTFWISTFFLVTAGLLILSHFLSQKGQERPTITLGTFGLFAIIVGVAQGIGTLPGISRSGITIATLLILHFPRTKVAEVSFLMSVPAVLGALLLDIKEVDFNSFFNIVPLPSLIGAMVLTFAVGYASLIILRSLLAKAQLVWFSVYLILIALWGFFY